MSFAEVLQFNKIAIACSSIVGPDVRSCNRGWIPLEIS